MLLLYNSQKIQYQIYSHSADWKAVFLSCHYRVSLFLRAPVSSSPEIWVVLDLYSSSVFKEILILGKAMLSSLIKWMANAFFTTQLCLSSDNTHTYAFTRTHGQDPELLTSLVGLLTSLLDTPKLIVLQIIFRTSQKGMGKSNWSEQLLLNNVSIPPKGLSNKRFSISLTKELNSF